MAYNYNKQFSTNVTNHMFEAEIKDALHNRLPHLLTMFLQEKTKPFKEYTAI